MKLTRMYEKRCNLLRFLTLNSTFHMFNGAAYPYKLSRLISLTLFDLCFTIEQLYQWRYSTYTIGIFRQNNFSQEAIRLTAGDGGLSTTVKHVQMLKVVLYKYL